MVQGGRREGGSGWGMHVYLWRIHVDVWQNQYNIVSKKKKKRILIKRECEAIEKKISHNLIASNYHSLKHLKYC